MYVQHVVTEMDESKLQCCVICGAVISDYRRTLYLAGDPPPAGFGAGPVYVSKGFPTVTTSITPEEHYKKCTDNP